MGAAYTLSKASDKPTKNEHTTFRVEAYEYDASSPRALAPAMAKQGTKNTFDLIFDNASEFVDLDKIGAASSLQSTPLVVVTDESGDSQNVMVSSA